MVHFYVLDIVKATEDTFYNVFHNLAQRLDDGSHIEMTLHILDIPGFPLWRI